MHAVIRRSLREIRRPDKAAIDHPALPTLPILSRARHLQFTQDKYAIHSAKNETWFETIRALEAVNAGPSLLAQMDV
jgi:hypothetical protein